MDVIRDDWQGEDANRVLGQKWTGETWFFSEGHVPVELPLRRRTRVLRRHTHDVPEPEIIKQLHTGDGVTRVGLGGSLSAMGIERLKIASAQRRCPEFAVYYAAQLAWGAEKDARKALFDLKNEDPSLIGIRKIDNILERAKQYELVDDVLFKRVYDSIEGEVQLRCCVPDVSASQYEAAGQGQKPLNYRNRLLLEYHNGVLAGHVGRERTMEMLERDFYWAGMREDVRRWCKVCVHCQGERAHSGLSAWTRTELYSRPFRVLQYDTVTCRKVGETGARYVLTVIDCFSRWVWLLPIEEKDAETIAKGLMQVFLGGPCFLLCCVRTMPRSLFRK
jgi:hypothetical protein